MRRKFPLESLPAKPDLGFESALWSSGLDKIAGIDEAGRGALAGPVAAAVLLLPADDSVADRLEGVRDSKVMTPKAREYWGELIMETALDWAVGFAAHQEIDEIGILPATRLAIGRALGLLQFTPQYLLIDYIELKEYSIAQTSLVKGDARSLSIAGASILAKTSRDDMMRQFGDRYPGYGFAANKGYGTRTHREALMSLGTCPIHRKSFRLQGIRDKG